MFTFFKNDINVLLVGKKTIEILMKYRYEDQWASYATKSKKFIRKNDIYDINIKER